MAESGRFAAKGAAMASPPDNVRTFTVAEDDDGIRLDRWFKRHLPDVSFNLVSRWARTGQLRLDGKRAAPGDRRRDRPGAARAARRGRARRRPEARAEARRVEPLTEDEARFVQRHGHRTRQGLDRAQQAARPRDAGRDQDRPAPRPPARRRWPTRRASGPSSSTGSTRIQSGVLLVARTRARRGAFRQGLFRPHRAQGLLGAGGRRARRPRKA